MRPWERVKSLPELADMDTMDILIESVPKVLWEILLPRTVFRKNLED